MNPNSLKNLKPVKKGEVRNPGGRPKSVGVDAVFRKLMEIKRRQRNKETGEEELMTIAEALAERAIQMAMEGDRYALFKIIERVDGLPLAKHEITGAGGGSLIIEASDGTQTEVTPETE